MRASKALALIATLDVLGCSGVTDVSPPPPPPAVTTFTAVIHGSEWTTNSVTISRLPNNVLEVTGVGIVGPWAGATVVLRIGDATGTGIHSMSADGDGSSLFIGGTSLGSDFTWSSLYYLGGGTITITNFSSNRIVGTFSGFANSGSGSAELLLIANGRFDVPY
jgi:hypothetical protein